MSTPHARNAACKLLAMEGLRRCLLWKIEAPLIHMGLRSPRHRAAACLELNWQILGGQLVSTWIWYPSQISSFGMDWVGEERWVEMPVDLLLAIYSSEVQESCQKDTWSSAQFLKSCEAPIAQGGCRDTQVSHHLMIISRFLWHVKCSNVTSIFLTWSGLEIET